ncbi:MAG: hypothetical protein A2Y33_15505 [Spirochaetes bacterium GWF1_51_8]|nr:MAG: hypothetical protein A2Y33_15505 [Spirochaetes bacterium GWF1_51_8]
MRLIILFLIITVLVSCDGNTAESGASISNTACYPWISVYLQEGPSIQTSVIVKVNPGEELIFTGKISNINMLMLYRCKEFTAPWYEVIRSKDNALGWIHGGAISTQKVVLPVYDKMVIGYNQFASGYSNFSLGYVLDVLNQSSNQFTKYGLYYKTVDVSTGGLSDAECVPIGDGMFPSGSILLNLYLKEQYGFSNQSPGYLLIEIGKTPRFVPIDMEGDADMNEIYLYFDVFSSGEYITPELEKIYKKFPRLVVAYNPYPGTTNDLWTQSSILMGELCAKGGIPYVIADPLNETGLVLKTGVNSSLSLCLTNYYRQTGFFYRIGFFFFSLNQTPIYIRATEDQNYEELIEEYFRISLKEQIIDLTDFGTSNL